jgi:hypothetical protein
MLEAAIRFEERPSDTEMGALVSVYNIQQIFSGW